MADSTVNSLRLSQEELEHIVAELDQDARFDLSQSVRRTRRWPVLFQKVILTVEDRRDEHTHFIVLPRNLSTGGMSVLHGGFLHPGTSCLVTVRRDDQSTSTLVASVMRCRHIERHIHEIGIVFESPINPREYLIRRCGQDYFNVEHVEPEDLEGVVLVVMAQSGHQREVCEGLHGSELELLYARDGASGLAQLEEQPNLVYVDMALPDMTTTEFLCEASNLGPVPPVVVVSDEPPTAQRGILIKAGAREVITRPLEPGIILRSAAEYLLLSDILAIETAESRSAALSSNPVEDLHAVGEALFKALLEESVDEILGLAEQAEKLAVTYGYAVIARRARQLAEAMAQTSKIAVPEMDLLIKACRRAAMPIPSSPSKRTRGPGGTDGQTAAA